MNATLNASPWGNRFAKWTAWGGVGAALLAVVGSYGSGFGLWNFQIGFLFIGAALLLAVFAVLFGLISLAKRQRGRGVMLGLACALIFLGIMGYWINRGASVPMIHDVTTDVAKPPAFQKLALRSDNLIGVETIDKWRELHSAAYGDIKPVTLAKSPADTIKAAEALARARGWDVALVAPDRIEATEAQSPFKFKDDVVITVAPSADGKGSVVNMRSVSRVGIGDLGVNAERVRTFLADLQK